MTPNNQLDLRPFRLDKFRQRFNGAKCGAAFLDVFDDDAVFFFQQHDEFERVNRVQPEAGAEERRVILDLLRRDVLELERLDDFGF